MTSETIQIIITILSLLAAILAWASKIYWSKQYKDAKEAQIESLKQQIENLKELTPEKIRTYFLSVKEQLEEYIELLDSKLIKANKELEEKKEHISRLTKEKTVHKDKLEEIKIQKEELEQKVLKLSSTRQKVKEEEENFIWTLRTFDNKNTENIRDISTEERDEIFYKSFENLSKGISNSMKIKKEATRMLEEAMIQKIRADKKKENE